MKLALEVGQGAPSASLLWDSSCLDMVLRVWEQKLLFVLYLRNLDEDTLASKVYTEQKTQKWPGLAAETLKICESLHIEDVNVTNQNLLSYKQSILKALHKENEIRLRLLGKGKCERIEFESYGKKDYLSSKNLSSVRDQYRTRYGLQAFAGNYSHSQKYASTNWLCRCKESREEESHIISGQCKVFGDLNDKFGDLSNDENLVKFFSSVLARRDQIDK